MGLSSSSFRVSCGKDRRLGLTLVEVAIGAALVAVIAVALGQILMATDNSIDYMTRGAATDQEIKRSMNRIADDLQLSASSAIRVTTGTYFDQLNSQRPNPNGNGQSGAPDITGVWQQNWQTWYQVVGTDLVRRILDSSGNIAASETLVRNLDDTGTSGKGFEVSVNGPVVGLTLRLQSPRRDGAVIARELTTSVFLKNN